MPQQPQAGARSASPPTASQLPSSGQGIQVEDRHHSRRFGDHDCRRRRIGHDPRRRDRRRRRRGDQDRRRGRKYRGQRLGVAGASKGDSAAVAGGSRTGIETAGGAEAGRATGFRGATAGGESAVRAGSVSGARDAAGNAIGNVRGGYADSSGYRQGGSLTAARNQWGYTAAAAVGGIAAAAPLALAASPASVGPGGNVVTAGRGAAFVNGQFVGGKAWTAVNGAYTRWGAFTPGWYGRYPGAWWPGKWAMAATAWATGVGARPAATAVAATKAPTTTTAET